jgi:glycosyltransferase involved in cell wall biosynthesis
VLRAQRRFARPDVVVGSCVHPLAVAAACLIGAARRVPFVFEVRDLWPQTLIDMGALADHGPAARALRAAERFLYHRARLVISLLPAAADYITAAGVPPEKIIYIPNGTGATDPPDCTAPVPDPKNLGATDPPDCTAPVPDPKNLGATDPPGCAAALADRIGRWRGDGVLVAGYVGSHGAANGIDILVRAAAVLRDRGVRDIALVLVGDGPDKRRCQQLAERLGLDNLAFGPPVPKRAVPGLLHSLDVALFPLRDLPVFRYGLSSNKLFDYLASGRPIVCASALAGNPVLASGGGICVRPEVPEAVADALAALAEAGPEVRRAIGEQGRSWVREHHDVTALAERLLTALEGVTS